MEPALVKKKIQYRGYLDDGTQFDSNDPGDLLEIIEGHYNYMKPIVDAVSEMEVGDEKVVHIPHQDAYGDYDEKAVVSIPRSYIKSGDKLTKGQHIIWHSKEKPQPVAVLVSDCDDFSVRLDFNHPLAGKDLDYWIKVVEAS